MAYENKELATIKKPNQIEYITKEEYDTFSEYSYKSLKYTINGYISHSSIVSLLPCFLT